MKKCKVHIKLATFLVFMALVASCKTVGIQTEDLSIRAVAGQFVIALYQDEKIDLFVISIPANAVLPDHQTGPRIIVLLTDLLGYRLTDGSEVKGEKDQVFYLDNTFSKGFSNSNESASYLVLSLTSSVLYEDNLAQLCSQDAMTQLFSQGNIVICKSEIEFNAKIVSSTLHYSHDTASVQKLQSGQKVEILSGDILLELKGELVL